MEKQKNILLTGMLPHYFKIAGVVILVISVLSAVVIKFMNIPFTARSQDMFRLVTINGFILGLLFVAWSKDKVEDELTMALRLKSMGMAFVYIVLYVIISPFVDMLLKSPPEEATGQSLVLHMLLAYMLLYYIQKKAR